MPRARAGQRAASRRASRRDTAGRLHTQSNLMDELGKVKRVIDKQIPGAPHETLISTRDGVQIGTQRILGARKVCAPGRSLYVDEAPRAGIHTIGIHTIGIHNVGVRLACHSQFFRRGGCQGRCPGLRTQNPSVSPSHDSGVTVMFLSHRTQGHN